MTYEGYGPNGVAVIVETLTDNKNRTATNVRAAYPLKEMVTWVHQAVYLSYLTKKVKS